MGFLPRTMGMRPRLACEMRAEGVVAARAEDANATLSAVERVVFSNGTASANGAGRGEKVAALKRVLDEVGQRGRVVTLVVPDAAVRVLLVDFDELPSKQAEALPVVRFRLKKLLPFDADDAAVSYQVMAQGRGGTQVLAVAMPRESLREYEAMVREAGYEAGAVLPSTLAMLAGLEESERPSLLVNAGSETVTTAIVKGGVLLLHRTLTLAGGDQEAGVTTTAAARQEPGRPETAGAMVDESSREATRDTTIAAIAARFAAMEGQRVPEAMPVSRVGSALASSMAMQTSAASEPTMSAKTVAGPSAASAANEIAQAVSVAAAYFEDTLAMEPEVVLSAGTLGAERLSTLLNGSREGMQPLRVEELASGVGETVPAGWLAGVRGALRS